MFKPKMFLILLVLVNCELDFDYHNYESLTSILKNYSKIYPTKTYLYSIGSSVQNRSLWVIAISDRNPDKHIILRPGKKNFF
jgi:hypothetical protein